MSDPGPSGPAVLVDRLHVTYRDERGREVVALADVSVAIAGGELVAVVGETGSGRSTFARCLNGIVPRLVRATVAGRVEVGGIDPAASDVATMASVVAVVIDDPEAQVTQPTVADEVAFGPENLGVPPDVIRARVADALERVDLGGFERRDPLTLSGGEQQRLAVAAALAMRPRVLVMDEPTANLDPRNARRILELARMAATDDGVAVVVVTRDADLVATLADRVLWLDGGRVRALGRTRSVFTTIARETDGALAPAVTALCAALEPADGRLRTPELPMTDGEAAAWIAAQPGSGEESPA